MKKYWLLLSLLISFGSVADTFFVSNRNEASQQWANCCSKGVCINKSWFNAHWIGKDFTYGYVSTKSDINSPSCMPTGLSSKYFETPEFVARISQAVQRSQGRVVIFVHGFNVTYPEGLASLEKISTSLSINSNNATPILFDWHSEGKTLSYTKDEEHARVGAIGFSYFVNALAKLNSVKEIHIISHSMGNRVAVDGLERATHLLASDASLTIFGQYVIPQKFKSISYFASDLNLEEHLLKSITVHKYFNNLHGVAFISSADLALKASRQAHVGIERAGATYRSGFVYCEFDPISIVKPTVVIPSVDVTFLGQSLADPLGHSYITRSPTVSRHLGTLLFSDNAFDYAKNYELIPIKLTPEQSEFQSIGRKFGCNEQSWKLFKN